MTRCPAPPPLDRDLADLPPELRWREWMSRVEAVIFAAAAPVPRAVLARVVGDDCPLDAVIADIRAELRARPYDLVPVAGGWHHRTRPHLAPVLQATRGVLGDAESTPSLSAADALLLAAIAYHQPVTRRDLERLLGQSVDADAVARLRGAGLVGPGPRSPRPGAPLTYVTTESFLDAFGLETLADLPNLDDVRALGLVETDALEGTPAGAPGVPETEPKSEPMAPLHQAPPPRTRPAAPDLKDPMVAVTATSTRVAALLDALAAKRDKNPSDG